MAVDPAFYWRMWGRCVARTVGLTLRFKSIYFGGVFVIALFPFPGGGDHFFKKWQIFVVCETDWQLAYLQRCVDPSCKFPHDENEISSSSAFDHWRAPQIAWVLLSDELLDDRKREEYTNCYESCILLSLFCFIISALICNFKVKVYALLIHH